MKIPALSIFKPKLPGQTRSITKKKQSSETCWRGLIKICHLQRRLSIAGEQHLHPFADPLRNVRAQFLDGQAWALLKSNTKSPRSSRLMVKQKPSSVPLH